MRILVTGGAGFIGSALVLRLLEDGYDVVVLDDFSRGRVDRIRAIADRLGEERSEQSKVVRGDIRSKDDVALALEGCSVVIHAAMVQGTQNFYSRPKDCVSVGIGGIMNLLDCCEAQGNEPDFVLISSSETYQIPPEGYFPTDETVPLSVPDVTNPRISYGGSKIASEIAVLAYADAGVLGRTVIVRPHNVYGPDMGEEHVIPQLARRMINMAPDDLEEEARDFPIQGSGQETRCFNYVDDAVSGLICAMEKGEHRNIYHLGTPEEVTIQELAYKMSAYYGRWVNVKPSELPQGSPPRRCPDVRKLMALGYKPIVNLAEGLPETLKWYAENPKVATAV